MLLNVCAQTCVMSTKPSVSDEYLHARPTSYFCMRAPFLSNTRSALNSEKPSSGQEDSGPAEHGSLST